MKIDTSNLGSKYFTPASRRGYAAIQWLGCVEVDGEIGALGLNAITGGYLMFSTGRRDTLLDTMEVLDALSHPVLLASPGRKAGPRGVEKQRGVALNDVVVAAARILGDGNLSRGLRFAAEYAASREDDFWQWAEANHNIVRDVAK